MAARTKKDETKPEVRNELPPPYDIAQAGLPAEEPPAEAQAPQDAEAQPAGKPKGRGKPKAAKKGSAEASAVKPTARAAKPAPKGKGKPAPKAEAGTGRTFRIAFVENTKTKRQAALTVRQDGVPQGSRYQAMFPGAARTWTEVKAGSYKEAVEAVRAGQGEKVRREAGK